MSMTPPMTHLNRRLSPELSTQEPSLPAPLALVNGSDGWDVRTALLDMAVRRRPDHVAFLGTCPCPVGGKAAPGASGDDPVVLSALPLHLADESAPTLLPRLKPTESWTSLLDSQNGVMLCERIRTRSQWDSRAFLLDSAIQVHA